MLGTIEKGEGIPVCPRKYKEVEQHRGKIMCNGNWIFGRNSDSRCMLYNYIEIFLLAFSLVLFWCFLFPLSFPINVLGVPLSVRLVQERPKNCQQKIQNLFLVRRQTGKAQSWDLVSSCKLSSYVTCSSFEPQFSFKDIFSAVLLHSVLSSHCRSHVPQMRIFVGWCICDPGNSYWFSLAF